MGPRTPRRWSRVFDFHSGSGFSFSNFRFRVTSLPSRLRKPERIPFLEGGEEDMYITACYLLALPGGQSLYARRRIHIKRGGDVVTLSQSLDSF